ncbi:MAG TPA: hypothetical protein VMR99_00455 [Candidatus Paceibacterota bacterium]|nr:hypothetical protein [Candidatus Paceibacterota bacterium]
MRHFFNRWSVFFIIVAAGILCALFYGAIRATTFSGIYDIAGANAGQALGTASDPSSTVDATSTSLAALTPIDTTTYNAKLLALANIPTHTITVTVTSTIPGTTTIMTSKVLKVVSSTSAWPVKTVYPDAGALLPFNRIVAYYGNFYSTQMGVLGQYPPDQMLQMLQSAAAEWAAADPTTPVIPALDYIAVTAQGSAGADGKYRDRMPASQIEEAISLANQVNGLVFLDVQVGWSNVETEVPLLAPYLKLPNVELSLDPEFDMEAGARPDTEIGTMDASDINFAANFLANIVNQNNLPPKILVIHRFTEDMVTNYKEITPLPQVEVVIDMDGWGSQAKKINTYQRIEVAEPVQFTGFKLFYKNDLLPPSTGMLTPQQILQLSPQPSYIQYQ